MGAIRLQDPDDASSLNLLEDILQACQGRREGGAIFAFASRPGIALLFDDDDFSAFVKSARFELVVGLDAVTNVPALELLGELASRYPRLVIKAFYHSGDGLTFHPKLCWFRDGPAAVAIVGSGNLTTGGLVRNWEAYSVEQLSASAATGFLADWQAWMSRHRSQLRPLSDAAVVARAKKNVQRRAAERDVAESDDLPQEAPDSGQVLIAEIPKAGSRWEQANFDLATFVSFFQLSPGKTLRVLLRHFSADGKVEGLESRPSVSVKSKNYRIELRAAKGLAYPSGPFLPIGVFVRTGKRQFVYRLVMPNDAEFLVVSDILKKRSKPRPGAARRLMRRVTLDVASLKSDWPNAPFWRG